MVRWNLHSTVDDAARNNMIIMHPIPPHLSFILDREWYRSQSVEGALINVNARTEEMYLYRVNLYTHSSTSFISKVLLP